MKNTFKLGAAILFLVTIILVWLKLSLIIQWSWWLIFTPWIIIGGAGIGIVLIAGSIVLFNLWEDLTGVK